MCVLGLFWHIQNRGKETDNWSSLFFRADVAVGLCGLRWFCARCHTHHCPSEVSAHGKKDPPLLCGPVLMPLFTRYYFNWLNNYLVIFVPGHVGGKGTITLNLSFPFWANCSGSLLSYRSCMLSQIYRQKNTRFCWKSGTTFKFLWVTVLDPLMYS